jgi:hypothetical protein
MVERLTVWMVLKTFFTVCLFNLCFASSLVYAECLVVTSIVDHCVLIRGNTEMRVKVYKVDGHSR